MTEIKRQVPPLLLLHGDTIRSCVLRALGCLSPTTGCREVETSLISFLMIKALLPVTINLTIGMKNFSKRGKDSDVVSEDMESNLNSDRNVNDEKLTLG